jgi:hypothetical protein
MNQTDPEKLSFKDSICKAYGLDTSIELNITAGKDEFYEIKKVIPEINKAIKVFKKNNCDPWYAQAILLIESPGSILIQIICWSQRAIPTYAFCSY